MKTFLTVLVLAFAMGGVTTEEVNNTAAPHTSSEKTAVPTTVTTTVTTTELPMTTTAQLPTKPKMGSWNVTDKGSVCIKADMGIRLTFNVTLQNKTSTIEYDVPADSDSTGECGPTKQSLVLEFKKTWKLEFDFIKKDEEYSIGTVVLTYDLTKDFETPVSGHAKLENQTLFQAHIGNSYMCKSDQPFKFDSVTPDDVTLSMMTVDLQVEAFRSSNGTEFGTAQECSADAATNNIVPIAVGAALAALVVIVLIAYLISRNRNKRGYESV